MKKYFVILAIGMALALAPALAGEGEKCEQETQTCLDYMAKNMAHRGYVGVELEESDGKSLTVKEVIDGTPARKPVSVPGTSSWRSTVSA